MDSGPEVGRAQGQGTLLIRRPVQQRPQHDGGWIADRCHILQRLRLQPDVLIPCVSVSSSGAWSAASNTVTATLLSDTTPAARPVVSSTGIGPTHVDLAWSYADTNPSPRFDIYVNGQLWHGQVAGTSKRIVFLSPNTTYTFRVRARDSAGNWSDLSDPFVGTTPAADPNDHQPPTVPPGFWGGVIDGATEAMVFWGNSTDNVTPQEHIRYTCT